MGIVDIDMKFQVVFASNVAKGEGVGGLGLGLGNFILIRDNPIHFSRKLDFVHSVYPRVQSKS